jgi:nucleoside-diphosphate-sugar epimerase
VTDGPTALVTGATGAVGPALVDRLLREGCRVRILTRGHLPAAWPPGVVRAFQGDVADPEAFATAMPGVDWVFHLAAALHVSHPGPETIARDERVNVEGARAAAEAAARAGASRLVFFSTIAVYGATGPDGADEDTTARPDSPYARSKLRAEVVVQGLHGRNGLGVTVLRLAAVYGPRVKGNYERLLRALEAGWFVPVGPGLNRRTLVHETDVAEAALVVARSREAAGRLYNVSDGQVHTLRVIVKAACRALGRPQPLFRVPLVVARGAARAGDLALSAARRGPRFASLLDKYTEDVAVRAERIQRELGFRPRCDLEAGWRDTVDFRRSAAGSARTGPEGPDR